MLVRWRWGWRLPPGGRRAAPILAATLVGTTVVAALGAGCGSRTALDVPPPLPPEPECDRDADCPGVDDLCAPVRCVDTEVFDGPLPEVASGTVLPRRVCLVVDALDCDDNDPCTADRCDPDTGLCAYADTTLDLDGDGFRAPRDGFLPGAPGSCGRDCNDSSALAFPDNPETCDGVDNDCNGIVDDGAMFGVVNSDPIRLTSAGLAPAGASGLAFDGQDFLALFAGGAAGTNMFLSRIAETGVVGDPDQEPFTFQNADAVGADIVWIGDRYGVLWQERRDGDYEVYFTLLNRRAEKAIPDVRLSNAFGFSINASLAWTGNEFIAVWQDERNGSFDIYGQRIDVEGRPVGSNVQLTSTPFDDEAPEIAIGTQTLALAYGNSNSGQNIRLRIFDLETLSLQTDTIEVTTGSTPDAVYPDVTWNGDRYLVTWFLRSGPQKAVFGATYDEAGTGLTPATAISNPGPFRSRYPTVLPLGDRTLFVYSDDRDQNDGYELYSRMVDQDLTPLGGEERLTNAPRDSVDPVVSFGAAGNVGILFRDDRDQAIHVWFDQLGCIGPE